jgi:hypothetical protein
VTNPQNTMTSRQRVLAALDHREPDRVPFDLGGGLTGIAASTVYRLRQALHLDPSGTPVKVVEPFQMLGEIKSDLLEALGLEADFVYPPGGMTMFGFPLTDWKPWTLFDGTPVLVPGLFNTEPEPDGSIVLYPNGDHSAPPSARMPVDGFYFDPIVRQQPIIEDELNPEDNMEEFVELPDAVVPGLKRVYGHLWDSTDKAIVGSFANVSFGDAAMVPGPSLRHPKGIRDWAEWYASLLTRPDYVWQVFERQCDVGLSSLAKAHAAVGEKVHMLITSAADFGMQTGPFIAPRTYRELFKPFHKAVNDWVHEHTTWKTFMHSCGSVIDLLPDFIEAGFDILNPVQCSAAGMDPQTLKDRFGDDIVFWGGGVDTQHTLPFGTPDEVRAEVRERIRIFGQGGGFVFATIHNIQAKTPVENLLAMFETVRECSDYG